MALNSDRMNFGALMILVRNTLPYKCYHVALNSDRMNFGALMILVRNTLPYQSIGTRTTMANRRESLVN